MSAPLPEAAEFAARTIRVLTVDAVRQAGIGHVGLALGCAEIGTVLFGEVLRHDPTDPDWVDRDRFVLSAGHGSMLLYSLLHLSGYAVSLDDLRAFRQLGSITPGHPEYGVTPGVETTTGPLGQGFANAVGMALAERILAARLGSELVDHRTYVLVSDGDLMEGVSSEAASLAGHLGLGRLIALYDDNGITIDGPTSLTFSEDVAARFQAYGWEVQRVNGHDPAAVRAALSRARESESRPQLICCSTRIGYSSPAVGTSKAHAAIPDEMVEETRANLGWKLPPFEVPAEAYAAFRSNAERGRALRAEWERRQARAFQDPGVRERWETMVGRGLPGELAALLPEFPEERPLATRQASGRVLNSIAEAVPSLIGGSADLSGSNSTGLESGPAIQREKFEGRNLCYGVREHAMGAIATGMALHGGIRPFVGTFLVFSDYLRPSIRLAALMAQPVIYVFTHDSIFVGEDGPTHQPVEQLAALRAIPGLAVWRPADPREVKGAWLELLARDNGPVVLALTRQVVPVLEGDGIEERARCGGYVLLPEPAEEDPELVIAATGSEVHLALDAGRALQRDGRRVRVVSLPCLEVFREQDADYRRRVLPAGPRRLVVEAGVEAGLAGILRAEDQFHGMTGFGASASQRDLAEHFGFTARAVEAAARKLLG